MNILHASSKDADKLTAITLASKSYWGYPKKWIQIWTPQLTIRPEYISSNETWKAVIANQPVAYYSLKQEDGELWLDNLWVLPSAMGKGVGKSLFDHAVKRGRKLGFVKLKIEADPNAASFYEKMGAHKIGERDHGEMDGQPRILPIMEINL